MRSLHFPFHVYVGVLHIQTTQGHAFLCANLAIDVRPTRHSRFRPHAIPPVLNKILQCQGRSAGAKVGDWVDC